MARVFLNTRSGTYGQMNILCWKNSSTRPSSCLRISWERFLARSFMTIQCAERPSRSSDRGKTISPRCDAWRQPHRSMLGPHDQRVWAYRRSHPFLLHFALRTLSRKRDRHGADDRHVGGAQEQGVRQGIAFGIEGKPGCETLSAPGV